MIRMLLFVLIINTCVIQKGRANQQDGKQKVTIIASDITLDNVLKQIEKQTGMRFMYAVGAFNVKERIKVSFQQTTLDDVLASLLRSRGMVWQYKDGTILLKYQANEISGESLPNGAKISIIYNNILGRILDSNGNPIPGATVLVKGTNKGTKTNADGSFILQNVEPGAVLLITFVGFETKEIPVRNEAPLVIKLKVAIGVLDEAVVIAYGTATNRNLVGNVSLVKGEDIARSTTTNPLLAIAGRVPGLNITQKTGFSGSAVVTLVQGQNSILKGNDPFYVIDGVPYPSQGLSIIGDILGVGGYNTQAKGSTLSFINPADIESITVLKDADATAIYGSRAANGAIIITTKKGKSGKTRFAFDYQHGIGKVARKLELMNTRQYLEMRHEAIMNDGGAVGETDYDVNGFWDTTLNTNWQKQLIGRTAQYMNINGSISGGGSNMQYLVGGTFHRETSVLPIQFNDQKGSVHFNINGNSDNSKFQMQLSGSYLVDNNKLPLVDLTPYAVTLAPDAPALYKPDGSLNFMENDAGSSTFVNPLTQLMQKYNIRTQNLVSNLLLSYSILPGLNIRSSFGYTNLRTDEIVKVPLTAYVPEEQATMQRKGYYGNYAINSWIVEPQISYNHIVGLGKLDLLIGTSIQHNNGNGNQITGTGFNSDAAIEDLNSAATLTSSGVSSYVYKYAGLFGRINYIYDGKYLIDVSARRDGSSRFGSANRFHNFGAVGLGWVFSMEGFVKNNLPSLSYGKLRFSYGTTGNDQIGDYMYLDLYNPLSIGVPYRGITSLTVRGIANPNLQWEETRKANFGLDLGFLKDKILLNVNYYINRSSNQLLPYQLPSLSGFSSVTINYPATVKNYGWEFSINGSIINRGKFHWNTNVNLTVPRNKLVAFKNLSTSTYSTSLIVGEPLTIAKVFHYEGVDKETGLYQFTDAKGNITTNPEFVTDQQTVVDLSPKWYAGLSSSFSYASFSLDFLFQFMKGKGANYFIGSTFPGLFNQNQPTYILDRWRGPEQSGSHQRYNADYTVAQSYVFALLSDASYSDASYCRLKNVSLGWGLPIGWLKRANITSARIYVTGQNLFTFTKYKGLDPETQSSISLPPLRTFVFGLQLNL